jgi:hypothetical protein
MGPFPTADNYRIRVDATEIDVLNQAKRMKAAPYSSYFWYFCFSDSPIPIGKCEFTRNQHKFIRSLSVVVASPIKTEPASESKPPPKPDEVEKDVDALAEKFASLGLCPPHKMIPHPLVPVAFCEYGCGKTLKF